MVKRRLGTRRVLVKPWYDVKSKDRSWIQKRVIARLERVAWKNLSHCCKTNAALVRYTWQRDLGMRSVGTRVRSVHFPTPVRDKYGCWDMKIRIPGLGSPFWHIVLFFFFYQRDFPRTVDGWFDWRKDCKKKNVEVNHIGGSPAVVNLDKLELKEKCGKYGNAAEGGALRRLYAKERLRRQCAKKRPARR